VSAQPLEAALAGLLAAHPLIEASEYEQRAAGERVREARGRFLPEVTLSGQSGYEHVDDPQRRSTGRDPTDMRGTQLTARATLNLFDGYERRANLEETRIDQEIAGTAADLEQQSVLFDGLKVYLQLVLQHELLELVRQEAAGGRRQLEAELRRANDGGGSFSDVIVARLRLQLIRERLVDLGARHREALIRYRSLYQTDPDVAAMTAPEMPPQKLPASVEEAVSLARAAHPEMRKAMLSVDQLAQRGRRAAAGYYPNVDLYSEAGIENDFDGTPGTRRDASVGVRFTWHLFSGLTTGAAVGAAAEERAAARARARFAGDQVAEQVALAWSDWQRTREHHEVLSSALDLAHEVLATRRQLQAAGRETALGTLEAELRILQARSGLIAADFEHRLAAYRIIFASGRLTPAFLGLAAG
jgi:adhesin transport system outer membrane protein